MKKILFLFGQPGSGRKTFIYNVINQDKIVQDSLGIRYRSVSVLDLPYDREGFMSDYRALEKRHDCILRCIEDYLKNDNQLLIVYGEHADYYDFNKSILRIICEEYPNLEKEAYFLHPDDSILGYERLVNTEWYKKDDSNKYKYQYEWYTLVMRYMKECLLKYEECGFKLTEIDTTDGYKVINSDVKKLELKSNDKK